MKADYKEGTRFTGGANTSPVPGAENPTGPRNGPVNTYTEAMASGGVVAIDPATGEKKWKFDMHDVNTSGILTTATDLLFVGGREGYFQALDARSGGCCGNKTWAVKSLPGRSAFRSMASSTLPSRPETICSRSRCGSNRQSAKVENRRRLRTHRVFRKGAGSTLRSSQDQRNRPRQQYLSLRETLEKIKQ